MFTPLNNAEKRIVPMLLSKDIEMVNLGITILVGISTAKRLREMFPWNSFRYWRAITEHKMVRMYRNSVDINLTGYSGHSSSIWIKGNVAVTIINNTIICRNLGLMKVLCYYDKSPKIIYET